MLDDRTRESAVRRFLAKVDKDGPLSLHRPDLGPCWIWKPLGGVGGYGTFYLGKGMTAHRASYILFIGPVPDGLVIDHLCRVRNCVRPSHFEAVTLAENTRRAQAWIAGANWQRSKTHCPHGHPYAGSNLRIAKDGKRCCRACAARDAAKRRARLLAENPPAFRPPKPPREFCANGHSWPEFGTMRGGKQVCRQCERDKVRRYHDRVRAERESPKRECKNGHPWTEENIYTDPKGRKTCRACHNERTLAAYHERKAATVPKRPRAPRETCANGHPWTPDNLYVTPEGLEKCRQCALDRSRRYEAKRKTSRPLKTRRTHCPHGHELAGDNLYIAPNGRKFCRECASRRSAEHQERVRAGTPTVANPAKGSWQREKEACPAGHEYDEANTYVPPSGGRKCRECIRQRTREFQRQKRAALKAAG